MGEAFRYCCCVPRENPVSTDALKFLVMSMNRDVEDSNFHVLRLSCMNRLCLLWNQQCSQNSRGLLVVESNAIPSRTQLGNTCRVWYRKVRPVEHWLPAGCYGSFFHVSRILEAERAFWSHDRRRYYQRKREDEVTAREQHHPGITHTGDEIWLLARLQGLPPECGPPSAFVRGQGDGWCVLEKAQICRVSQSYSFDDWSEYLEGPNCTLEMLRDSGQNGSDSKAWVSHLLKEFDRGSKERSAKQRKTFVQLPLFATNSTIRSFTGSRKLFGVCVNLSRLT